MRQLIVLTLALLLWIEPLGVHAMKAYHYQLTQAHFGNAPDIPSSPFQSGSTLPTQKQLGLAGLGVFPTFTLFFPAGFMFLGTIDVTNSVVGFMNKVENLNKITKELTSYKILPLLPYLGKDGLELLNFFLFGKQKVTDIDQHVNVIRPFSSNGQRNKGVSALMMRDLTDQFIQQFQEKKNSVDGSSHSTTEKEKITSARGTSYQRDLRGFLTQLGYVTWSAKTVHAARSHWPSLTPIQREVKLYTLSHKIGATDKDGAARAKTATSYIQKQLNKYHLNNELEKNILHDLGLIHEDDYRLLENELPQFLEGTLIRDAFKRRLQLNYSALVTMIRNTLDKAPLSQEEFKNKIDLATLQTLVTKEELADYLHKNQLALDKKNIHDQLIVYKLAFIKSLHAPGYSYLSLDEDIQKVEALLIKTFHKQEINNDLYRIVCLKNEDIILPSLTFIAGIGYISLGVLKSLSIMVGVVLQNRLNALNALVMESQAAAAAGTEQAANASQISQLQTQIEVLTQIVNALNLASSAALVAAGTINIALNSYFIITKMVELQRLSNSKKVSKLLDAHLEMATNKSWIQGEQRYKSDLIRFNALSDHYLKRLKERSLLNSVGLNFIWLAFSSFATLNGTLSILITLGVTALAATGFFIGTGFGVVVSMAAIPIAMVVLRELKLQDRLTIATRTIDLYQSILDQKNRELSKKHRLLLSIFIKNIKESMDLALYGTMLDDNLDKLSQKMNYPGIEKRLVKLYHARKKIQKHWEKMQKDPETRQLLGTLLSEELARNNINIDTLVTTKMSASTFRSGIDVIANALHPGISSSPTGTFLADYALPPCDPLYEFERDTILSKLFNHTFQIYNNIRKDIVEYRYLLTKRNLQIRYFNTPLSNKEQNLLLHRYNRRQSNSRFTLNMNNLENQISDLVAIHHPLPKGKLVAWDEQFLVQLSNLMKFSEQFKSKITHLRTTIEEEPSLEFPNHNRIELLVQYFLPLAFNN